MAQHDARRAGAAGDGGADVGLLAQRQNDAAHQPRHARKLGKRDRNDDIGDGAMRDAEQRDGDQNGGDCHKAIDDPHDDRIEPSNEARSDADENAKERCNQGDRGPHDQRRTRAIDDARIDVAAKTVGAEPIGL